MREQMLKLSNKKLKRQMIIAGIFLLICACLCIPYFLSKNRKAVEIDSLRDGMPFDEFLDLDEYDELEGKYVSLDVQYVLDKYYKKTNSSKQVTDYGFLVYDGESGYMLGIYVSKSDANDVWLDLEEDTYDYLSGETNREPKAVTIKGTFRKMDGAELRGFKTTAEDWAENVFGWDMEERTLMYTIDTSTGLLASEVWVAMMGVLVYGFGLWFVIVLIMMLSKEPVRKINKFMKKNGIVESEADADFASAKIIKNVYVGRKYTFFIGACNWDMFKNTDLVWAYYYRRTGRYAVSRINAYHYNKKASYINLSRAVAEEVLEYYAQILPQIIVGYSADLEKEYMKNFNTFLSHRYNPAMSGQNDAAQTAAAEDKGSGFDTYSPVFTETGEYAVKLTYVNQERLVATIKAVREMGGYGLAEAKAIVESSGVVLKNVSYNAAEEAKKELAQFDCTVDIVNVTEL